MARVWCSSKRERLQTGVSVLCALKTESEEVVHATHEAGGMPGCALCEARRQLPMRAGRSAGGDELVRVARAAIRSSSDIKKVHPSLHHLRLLLEQAAASARGDSCVATGVRQAHFCDLMLSPSSPPPSIRRRQTVA